MGMVWFGCQWDGSPSEMPPQIVGRAGLDRPIKLLDPQGNGSDELKGYIGAMAVSRDGRLVAASAPKAGKVLHVDAETGTVIGQSSLKDVSGIAPQGSRDFAASSGFGIFRYETASGRVLAERELQSIAFDNHLRKV